MRAAKATTTMNRIGMIRHIFTFEQREHLVMSSGADTTPACTRAYAHFSRAHLTRDDCTCGSRVARLKIVKCCAISQSSVISPSCPCQVCLLVIFPMVTSSLTCSLSRPSASPASFGWNQKSPLRLCSMEWNIWLYCQSDSRHRL